MTTASSKYFERVAEEWDTLRAGYFTEAVRESAIAKAYLRPEMIVADVGAGTGFMAAGLTALASHVHVVDGSAAMLDVARRNLSGSDNVTFHKSDGHILPLPAQSVDAVFANMYLHHCPQPLAAIHEMVRVLRPGGRLVITDLDTHPYAWLKEEMADEWMGFERAQVKAWFRQAGLVNIIVDCTGQSCCAESQNPTITDARGRKATISVFVATGSRRVIGAHEAVLSSYAALATSGCDCSQGNCCSSEEIIIDPATGYTTDELAGVPSEAARFSLGCGNPTAMASLRPGEVVLDIGSGGGIDAFYAARRVGPTGRVIGIDATPAMLERARKSAAKAGLSQVEFRLGEAEALPVEDSTVDVILSNCVINLCEDKGRVFEEAYRVLKDGGRLSISDIVSEGPLPMSVRSDAAQWAGCVHGALPEREYLDLVAQAGFQDIVAARNMEIGSQVKGVRVYSLSVTARKGSHKLSSNVILSAASASTRCGSSCCCS